MNCMICDVSGANGYKTNGARWACTRSDAKYRFCDKCAEYVLPRFKRKNNALIDPDRDQWIEVVKDAWDAEAKCFRCKVSHLPIVRGRYTHPLSPTLDHIVPGSREGGWQLVTRLVNTMKSNMTMEEFAKVVPLLASHMDDPEMSTDEFSNIVENLKHWS